MNIKVEFHTAAWIRDPFSSKSVHMKVRFPCDILPSLMALLYKNGASGQRSLLVRSRHDGSALDSNWNIKIQMETRVYKNLGWGGEGKKQTKKKPFKKIGEVA